jgi:histidine triad (HIT) family protein
VAFHHPRPSWNTHILIVPKVGIASLLAVRQRHEPAILESLALAQRLGRSLNCHHGALALIINGGGYQSIGQLHIHLIAGPGVPRFDRACAETPGMVVKTGEIAAYAHPDPIKATHIVLRPAPRHSEIPETAITERQIRVLIETTQRLVGELDLAAEGFALAAGAVGNELDYSCFHLISDAGSSTHRVRTATGRAT